MMSTMRKEARDLAITIGKAIMHATKNDGVTGKEVIAVLKEWLGSEELIEKSHQENRRSY